MAAINQLKYSAYTYLSKYNPLNVMIPLAQNTIADKMRSKVISDLRSKKVSDVTQSSTCKGKIQPILKTVKFFH